MLADAPRFWFLDNLYENESKIIFANREFNILLNQLIIKMKIFIYNTSWTQLKMEIYKVKYIENNQNFMYILAREYEIKLFSKNNLRLYWET